MKYTEEQRQEVIKRKKAREDILHIISVFLTPDQYAISKYYKPEEDTSLYIKESLEVNGFKTDQIDNWYSRTADEFLTETLKDIKDAINTVSNILSDYYKERIKNNKLESKDKNIKSNLEDMSLYQIARNYSNGTISSLDLKSNIEKISKKMEPNENRAKDIIHICMKLIENNLPQETIYLLDNFESLFSKSNKSLIAVVGTDKVRKIKQLKSSAHKQIESENKIKKTNERDER